MQNRLFFRTLARCSIALLALGGMIFSEANGQTVTEKDVKQIGAEIRAITKLRQLAESRSKTVERKAAFVEKLRRRLDATLSETDSADKKRRMSLFAFELFVAEARLSGEKLKLWHINKMTALQSKLDTPDEGQAIREFLEELAKRRKEAVRTLMKRSNELAPLITDELIQSQFKAFVARLQ